jgi:hypothetical protein
MSITCRGAVRESFRRTIVVKDVRLRLNLATVHRRYGIPVVHLRRHPCAVVSSLLSARWNWSFDRLRMATLLEPFIGDLRDEDLQPLKAAGQCDGDAISRITAYWAMTERLTERALRHRPWATILAYEDAVQKPQATGEDLCKLIGRRACQLENPNLDSATTYGASRGIPSHLRPYASRGQLAVADIDRIYRIVGAIFPEALAGLPDVGA